ncbi:hypothetical protein C8J56DRAFT_1087088 [Mycena floridula]|nr:hypothetical protein C8J56DRAFT_1087088 [Mycena floridula]
MSGSCESHFALLHIAGILPISDFDPSQRFSCGFNQLKAYLALDERLSGRVRALSLKHSVIIIHHGVIKTLPGYHIPFCKVPASILLADVEEAMSAMSASTFWIEANGGSALFANEVVSEELSQPEPVQNTRMQHSVTVMDKIERHRVAVHLPNVYLLIAITVVLLGLPIPGIMHKNDVKIQSAGMLQIIWLLQDNPEIQDKIGQVSDPTEMVNA